MYLAFLLALAFLLLIRKHRGYDDDACDNGLATFMIWSPQVRVLRIMAPTSVFPIFPFPPDKEIPPITAEAMAFIS